MKLTFLGATQTVTGSKFLLDSGDHRVLIDCGLFQGMKELRLRNWADPPVEPSSIDSAILTHAHIDHTGYLPRFVAQGFKGPVRATSATVDLGRILLPDAAHLQEEEARFRNKHRRTKHAVALPLYTIENAEAALQLLRPVKYGETVQLSPSLLFDLVPAGHIFGSSFVRFHNGIVFTGDIGRYNQPIIFDPTTIESAEYLVLESTYGNRLHTDKNGKSGKDQLRDVILATAQRGGTVLIPSFAIGRAQEILYTIRELETGNEIPVLPVYIDSPMAVDAFSLFQAHKEEHDQEMKRLQHAGTNPLQSHRATFVRSVEESKAINDHRFPSIIISANGMATGGRILHHLINRITDDRNSIVFVGFQAAGTRGRLLADGARQIRIFGMDYPVRAAVHVIDSFSAHADYVEILQWLKGFKRPPRKTFLVHGEPRAAQAMKEHILAGLNGWDVEIPTYLQSYEL
jgi:metallo-beta-lactamase family protein